MILKGNGYIKNVKPSIKHIKNGADRMKKRPALEWIDNESSSRLLTNSLDLKYQKPKYLEVIYFLGKYRLKPFKYLIPKPITNLKASSLKEAKEITISILSNELNRYLSSLNLNYINGIFYRVEGNPILWEGGYLETNLLNIHVYRNQKSWYAECKQLDMSNLNTRVFVQEEIGVAQRKAELMVFMRISKLLLFINYVTEV